MKKIITGAKPTGEQLHIGNLLGAVLPFGDLAKNNDAAIFVADLHALNQITDAKTLRHNIDEIPYEYLAILGLDTPFTIFRQSDIHSIPMLQWVLNNVTPFSLMARAHSYKDFQQKIENEIRRLGKVEGIIEQAETDLKSVPFLDGPEIRKTLEKSETEKEKQEKMIQDLRQNHEYNLNM